MGFLDRILRSSKPAEAGPNKGAAKSKGGAAAAPAAAAALVRPKALCDDDSDDSDGDIFGLPSASSIAAVSAPVCAARRGALDMGGDSMSDSGAPGRRSSATGGRLGGVSMGGSEIEALYSDVVLIHRGRHAMIYRARERRSRRRVVLKAYVRQQRNPVRAQALDREQRMLRMAGPHAGVLGLERVLENADATYLVLDAGTGGTLMELIANSGGRLPDHIAARKVALPLLRALAHLHARGIVHRDLKPEHVLLMPDGLKVADFSCAARLPNAPPPPPPPPPDVSRRTFELRRSIEARHARNSPPPSGAVHSEITAAGGEQQQGQQQPDPPAAGAGAGGGNEPPDILNHRVGSLEYAAPEMLSKPTAAEVFHLVIAHGMDEEELPVYDEKVDVWSLGALLFEALTGCQPFLADGAAEMAAVVAERLQARDAESGLPLFLARAGGLSADAKDFVARCLDPSPAARPAACDLLAHPWISRRASLAVEALAPADEAAEAAAGEGSSSTPLAHITRCMSDAVMGAHGMGFVSGQPGSERNSMSAAAGLPLCEEDRVLRRTRTATDQGEL